MLDTPVVHISVVVGITYLVYRLKMGDYGICSYVDKPISHLIMLSCVLVFSESYLVLSIILLFGYVLVIDECYIKKWEDAFSKISVNDGEPPVQKCTIREVQPIYEIPSIDPTVREEHREAFVGREYYSTN